MLDAVAAAAKGSIAPSNPRMLIIRTGRVQGSDSRHLNKKQPLSSADRVFCTLMSVYGTYLYHVPTPALACVGGKCVGIMLVFVRLGICIYA